MNKPHRVSAEHWTTRGWPVSIEFYNLIEKNKSKSNLQIRNVSTCSQLWLEFEFDRGPVWYRTGSESNSNEWAQSTSRCGWDHKFFLQTKILSSCWIVRPFISPYICSVLSFKSVLIVSVFGSLTETNEKWCLEGEYNIFHFLDTIDASSSSNKRKISICLLAHSQPVRLWSSHDLLPCAKSLRNGLRCFLILSVLNLDCTMKFHGHERSIHPSRCNVQCCHCWST